MTPIHSLIGIRILCVLVQISLFPVLYQFNEILLSIFLFTHIYVYICLIAFTLFYNCCPSTHNKHDENEKVYTSMKVYRTTTHPKNRYKSQV